MDSKAIIQQLSDNAAVFEKLFTGLSKEEYLWRPAPDKWCLLEILCHLYDEEREDFRARVKHILETPDQPMPGIDPVAAVTQRNYIGWDFEKTLHDLLAERRSSIDWLRSLQAPKWDNAYQHPKVGPITASMILTNWPAHDMLHMRQILHTKFQYLQHTTGENLDYAGIW